MWSKGRQRPWDTWQHRSSPLRKAEHRAVGHMATPELTFQEDRAQSHGTRGSTEAHLIKKAMTRAEGHVTAPELTSAWRRGTGPCDTWWRRRPLLQGGVIRSYSLRDSAWMHIMFLILTWSLYVEVPGLQDTDSRLPYTT
jgi:hypothetical protein